MKRDDSELLETMKEAVAAAAVVTRRASKEIERLRTLLKADKSPVTVADLASQAIVSHVLASRHDDIPLVGEEDAAALDGDRAMRDEVLRLLGPVWAGASADAVIAAIDRGRASPAASCRFFTLDPIDGTKGFLRSGHYAISLALIENGVVRMGVLACPGLSRDRSRSRLDVHDPIGCMAFAAAGAGAREVGLDDLRGPAVALRVGSLPPAQLRLAESVESGHTKHAAAEGVLARVAGATRTVERIRLDSQAKYAVLARGQADVYLRMPTQRGYVERIWDHAAGALVATEAGLWVGDVRGAALDFSTGRGLENNLGVVAAHPDLKPGVLSAIAELGYDQPVT